MKQHPGLVGCSNLTKKNVADSPQRGLKTASHKFSKVMEVNGNNSSSITSFQSFELLLCLKIVLNFKFFTVEDLQLYRTGIGLFFFLLVFPRCAFRLNKRVDRAIYRSCRNSRIQMSNSRYAGWMWPNTFLRVHTHAFLDGLNTEVTFCTEHLDHNSSSFNSNSNEAYIL